MTANPTAEWIAQQISEAFPWDEAPRYLVRDRDTSYGASVSVDSEPSATSWTVAAYKPLRLAPDMEDREVIPTESGALEWKGAVPVCREPARERHGRYAMTIAMVICRYTTAKE